MITNAIADTKMAEGHKMVLCVDWLSSKTNLWSGILYQYLNAILMNGARDPLIGTNLFKGWIMEEASSALKVGG